MLTLSDDWIELAASHGATKWVQQFIRTFLPQLNNQTISPETFAQNLEDELRARQLNAPGQQKNYRSNVVQALKTIALDHPAIALVSPTSEEYRELNDAQRGKLADRQTRYFTSDQAQTLVDRATALLDSAEWAEVAAGLAVLIGRRISEILLSRFLPKSDWSLIFSEMAKKQGTDGLTIEIPSLAPAALVLDAIERLQKSLRIDDLKLNSRSPKMAKQVVNQRFSESVANKCVEHFSDLVPARSDRDQLYTHIFRACYAAIAAHWFCPPNVPEHNFKAEIQGHFTLAKDGRKLPNYSARANYDDYAIGTTDGNRDGRLGIKLGVLPGLQVIEAFKEEASAVETEIDKDEELKQDEICNLASATDGSLSENNSDPAETMPKAALKPRFRRPEVLADDWDEMFVLMARRGVSGATGEVFHALIDALKSTEDQQIRTVADLSSSFSWFTNRINALERDCQKLQQECDLLRADQAAAGDLKRLQDENALLKQKLEDTESQLLGIRQFLGMNLAGDSRAVEQPTSKTPQRQPVAPAPSTQAKVTVSDAPSRRKRGDTDEKLNQIVDAILTWNSCHESHEQLRVSIPTIKALASAMGANYQPAIQAVLKERSAELEEHHSRFLIGSRHNAGVVHKDQVLQAIAREYLGLENLIQVKY